MAKRILLVEDDQQASDGLKKILEKHGHQVTVAETMEEVGQAIAGGLDVALVDLHLPGLPGDQFATFLKMRAPSARIILISGEYTVVDPSRFGADTLFFPKPLDIEKLLEAVSASGSGAATPV